MLNVIKYSLQGRSRLWSRMRSQFLKLSPKCTACDSDRGLEVHHIRPFHLHPELELEASNLVTLCKYCHLVIGHLRDYTYYNLSVLEDCQKFKDKRREFKDGGENRD
jgi:5-methylcytosine-specific restriction endonuclease McrA